MTRRGLLVRISLALAIYAAAIVAGFDIRFRFPKREDLHYVLYKDLLPLVVAMPALWLAYCFQKRAGYSHQLRAAWGDAVLAAQGAIRHTRRSRPTSDDQAKVLEDLGVAIDAVRGLFRPGRTSPASSLEAIRDAVEGLGSGEAVTPLKAEAARSAIVEHWEAASGRLLHEFDRVPASTPGRPRTSPAKGDARPHFERLTAPLGGR